ncbi:MAG: FAD binding domain-containing protein [Gammaproteobacteria bacterium]
MIPGAFDYHRPSSVSEAVELMVNLGDDAAVLAGGHSLIPMMKLRMAQPEHLVDLQDLCELRGIRIDGARVAIGAMTTQSEIIASSALADACPLLRATALQIADPQVRNKGTLGGNAANGDPGNDMPAALQALDATYRLQGPDGARDVKARDYYEAAYFTARADAEILTEIVFDAPPAGHGCCYEKQKRKIGDYATAAAAVIVTRSGDLCSSACIALTNVGDTPLYAVDACRCLQGTRVQKSDLDAAAAAARAITMPAADGRGPAVFRSQVAGIMVRRAVARAFEMARG